MTDAEQEVATVKERFNFDRRFGELGNIDLERADRLVLIRMAVGAMQDDGFDNMAARFKQAAKDIQTPQGLGALVRRFITIGGR